MQLAYSNSCSQTMNVCVHACVAIVCNKNIMHTCIHDIQLAQFLCNYHNRVDKLNYFWELGTTLPYYS